MHSSLVALIDTGVFNTAAFEATGQPIPTDCNRACLEGAVGCYLAAVVAHDPKQLPLAASVKFTETIK